MQTVIKECMLRSIGFSLTFGDIPSFPIICLCTVLIFVSICPYLYKIIALYPFLPKGDLPFLQFTSMLVQNIITSLSYYGILDMCEKLS